MDNRDIQINNAQNNPNILSPLSGAPRTGTVLGAQTGSPYEQGQQMSKDMADKLYGTGTASGMAGNIDQMTQALFDYDKKLEGGYSPFPQQPNYVENPNDLYQAGQNYASAAGANIGRTQTAVQSVDQAYQNAINSVLNQFTDFLRLQQEKEQIDKDQENKDLEYLLKFLGLAGGEAEFMGKKFVVPPPEGDYDYYEANGRKYRYNTRTRQTEDLGPANIPINLFPEGVNEAKPTAPPQVKKPSLDFSGGGLPSTSGSLKGEWK